MGTRPRPDDVPPLTDEQLDAVIEYYQIPWSFLHGFRPEEWRLMFRHMWPLPDAPPPDKPFFTFPDRDPDGQED